MFISLKSRRRQLEWMDDPDADPKELEQALRFLRRINRLLCYTRATLSHLERFSRGWKRDETIRIVDLGTGSADIPMAILRWADARGFSVRIVGLDLHADTTLAAVKQAAGDPRLKIVRGNVLAMPLADGAFDYAVCNMFLHHLDDAEVVQVLRSMNRLARRGIIFADLVRSQSAYWAVKACTLLANSMVRHDAAVSVGQAFTEREVMGMRDRAGIDYARYHRHFGHRFVLCGEKGDDNAKDLPE